MYLKCDNKAEVYVFLAFKSEEDFNNASPYFERVFDNHTEMKVFSAQHSLREKELYPGYVSTYHSAIRVRDTKQT